MNTLECAIAVIARHREARTWTDAAVAANVLAELGVDPTADAPHASAIDVRLVTADQVAAAEAIAEQHAGVAAALRAKLDAQVAPAQAATDVQQQQVAAAQRAEAERGAAQRLAVPAEDRRAIEDAAQRRIDEQAEADKVAAAQRAEAEIGMRQHAEAEAAWNSAEPEKQERAPGE